MQTKGIVLGTILCMKKKKDVERRNDTYSEMPAQREGTEQYICALLLPGNIRYEYETMQRYLFKECSPILSDGGDNKKSVHLLPMLQPAICIGVLKTMPERSLLLREAKRNPVNLRQTTIPQIKRSILGMYCTLELSADLPCKDFLDSLWVDSLDRKGAYEAMVYVSHIFGGAGDLGASGYGLVEMHSVEELELIRDCTMKGLQKTRKGVLESATRALSLSIIRVMCPVQNISSTMVGMRSSIEFEQKLSRQERV